MRLFEFPGGVHPDDHKELTRSKPLEALSAPELLNVSMAQHLGAPAQPLVKPGERVLVGQKIGEPRGFISAAVHSPVSGKVKRLTQVPHPELGRCQAVLIENDGEDERGYQPPERPWSELEPKRLVELLAEAGVVGLGGATFPSHVKLSPPENKPIDTVILNGVECEPYLTSDHRLMLERPDDVVLGLKIVRSILGAKQALIAVESNKSDAAAKLSAKLIHGDSGIEIVVPRVRYPQGAEKQLIYACTKRRVPNGGLPMDVGCVVHNVGTAVAIRDALVDGRPLISRALTITGMGVDTPKNLLAAIGTPLSALVDACGGLKSGTVKVISGGPMMGIALGTLDQPMIKSTGGLLCLTASETFKPEQGPCIRCGRCIRACPMRLQPTLIAARTKLDDFDECLRIGARDCMECGCCAYSCPAGIPLVQYIKLAKSEIAQLQRRRKEEAR
ncbi:MAG: electron transport complex subunit RsxC [Candidatus Alcyoniella australis]|nr:electron transport complex subunit RsxC [Candidatus Alcyoniella australis]